MRNKKGFTLVELLVVVLILAALAAIAIPRISASATTARINACQANVQLLNSQIELYRADTGTTLATGDLGDLTSSTAYFPDGAPVCAVDATAYAIASSGHITSHGH